MSDYIHVNLTPRLRFANYDLQIQCNISFTRIEYYLYMTASSPQSSFFNSSKHHQIDKTDYILDQKPPIINFL